MDEVISQNVPVPRSTEHTGSRLIDQTVNDLDAYWAEFFKVNPASYRSPAVVTFDQAILSGCGILDPWTTGTGYCFSDSTIYLDVTEMDLIGMNFGPFTEQLIIAHEWSHHIQNQMGIELGNPAFELQADCFAGSWARDLATRTGLTEDDLIAAVALMIFIGGDETHGWGTNRTKEFLDGFYDGSQACVE